ncbi:PilZ domain-containing protein, partial [Planctomycetota bacterium]
PFEREDTVKRLTKVHLMKMGAGSGGFFRSSIRLTTPLPIMFSSGGIFAKKHDGRTLDISPEGAKIQSNVILKRGVTLTIILDIPKGGRIKVGARVANVQHDKLHSTYEAGVEFVKISDKDKDKLSNYIMQEASKV